METRDWIAIIKAARVFLINQDDRNGDGDCAVCGEHDLHKHDCATLVRRLENIVAV